MPLKDMHVARQEESSRFVSIRSGAIKGAPAGVTALFGATPNGRRQIASIRFDSRKFSPKQAKDWLRERGFKTTLEVAANSEKFERTFAVEKFDDDKMQVFGWSYVTADKHDVKTVDHSLEVVHIDDVEAAQYGYVKTSRAGREMHRGEDVATLIESVVFTPAKKAAMGIPDGVVPTAAWVGYQLESREVFDRVKSGEYGMLSIGGTCRREEI